MYWIVMVGAFGLLVGFAIGVLVSPNTTIGRDTYTNGRHIGQLEMHCWDMNATLSSEGDCVVVHKVFENGK